MVLKPSVASAVGVQQWQENTPLWCSDIGDDAVKDKPTHPHHL